MATAATLGVVGRAVFGISVGVWLAASRISLGLAYPINALGYLVSLCASMLVLHEPTNVFTWVGTLSPWRDWSRVLSKPGTTFGRCGSSWFS